MEDLHQLPRIRDSLSFLYVERARIDRCEKSVSYHDAEGETPIPAASLALLMLGPGTSITHAAVRALTDNSCLVAWCGEENVRFYAFGGGGTRHASALIHQARLASDEQRRLDVVKRMYRMRFPQELDQDLTVERLRGMEGVRVREAYARLSRESGVAWSGRSYDRSDWHAADSINRALSAANSCLYGVCHAAIVSLGYSPGLGFIHTGKMLSFVYDVADFYKTELSVPVAFHVTKENPPKLEREVRCRMRDVFRESRLLKRIVPDIRKALGDPTGQTELPLDEDGALPTPLWTPSWEVGDDGSDDS